MVIRSRVTMLIVGTFLTGCASGTVRDLNIRDWVGHNERHLTASWGAPHHSYTMVASGKMIGYQFTAKTVTWWPRRQMITEIRDCMVNFETDRSGTILDASATGANCRIGPQEHAWGAHLHGPALVGSFQAMADGN